MTRASLALLALPLALAACGAIVSPLRIRGSERVVNATDFGVKADGMTDDGPAIQRMLAAASSAAGPARLLFPAGRRIRVATAPERYALRFDGAVDVTLDGQGSTFLLGPDVRFLRLRGSRRITVRSLQVDFDPLPFVDGTVAAVNAKERYLDVSVGAGEGERLRGGPTKQDGEQAFFAMLWHSGAYGLVSRHYWTERMEPGSAANTVRVFTDGNFREFGDIKPGEWRISLPVPGIAHRYGPGGCVDVFDNDTVTFEDVEVWSAPWFAFRVIRNRGEIVFRRVHVRPKPGTGRLTSSWRDGFHVKGNSGSLLWEECILSGMNDDAFNISTHCSRVRKRLSPTTVEVVQTYPLDPMPWHEGNTLSAADFGSRTLLGTARIIHVAGWTTERRIDGQSAASPVTLSIDRPIPGLDAGAMVWEPESANPHTTLHRCTIENSCRFQSPVTLEGCDATALLWFYAEEIEGPFPSHVVVRDCLLRRGRGNPRLAVSFAGRVNADGRPSAIRDVVFERNRVWGDFSMIGLDRARLDRNEFLEPGARVRIEGCTAPE